MEGQMSLFPETKPVRKAKPKVRDPGKEYEERMKRFWHYMDHQGMDERWIETAPGELRLLVDALADYRDILQRNAEGMEAYPKAVWLERVNRLGKIQKKMESSIGYDREKHLETCGKRRRSTGNIGGDALSIAVRGAE